MEFENLQIEVPLDADQSLDAITSKIFEKKHKNYNKGFVVGFNPNSKEARARRERRARRFGMNTTVTVDDEDDVTADETDQTRENQLIVKKKNTNADPFENVNLNELEWPAVTDEAFEEIRLDAIHVHGVNHMSTKDVFEYFENYGAEHIEWVDDDTCNVVWDDETMVMRALDELSQTYVNLRKIKKEKGVVPAPATTPADGSNQNELADDSEVVQINDVVNVEDNIINGAPAVKIKQEKDKDGDAAVDSVDVDTEDEDYIHPKDVWRIAAPYNEIHQLFFRAATIKDKKLPGAAQRSEYYLMYGRDPDATKNGPGVITATRKRKLQNNKDLIKERFNSRQPDVAIVTLAELKREGVIQKMDVDAEEPVVKRINRDDDTTTDPGMGVRLADRFSNIDTPLPLDDEGVDEEEEYDEEEEEEVEELVEEEQQRQPFISSSILSRRMQGRIGTGNVFGTGITITTRLDDIDVDVMDDSTIKREDVYEQHFEEDQDCVHDIYRVANDSSNASTNRPSSAVHPQPTVRSSISSRLTLSTVSLVNRRQATSPTRADSSPEADRSPSSFSDLRDKLKARRRQRGDQNGSNVFKKEEEKMDKSQLIKIKDEKEFKPKVELESVQLGEEEKPNLCIEIKREAYEITAATQNTSQTGSSSVLTSQQQDIVMDDEDEEMFEF